MSTKGLIFALAVETGLVDDCRIALMEDLESWDDCRLSVGGDIMVVAIGDNDAPAIVGVKVVGLLLMVRSRPPASRSGVFGAIA